MLMPQRWQREGGRERVKANRDGFWDWRRRMKRVAGVLEQSANSGGGTEPRDRRQLPEAAGRYEPVYRLVAMRVAEAVESRGGLLMRTARAVRALFGEEARQRA